MSGPQALSEELIQALLRRERQALVARLLPGMVHNISGAMQMVRLPLDLIELQLGQKDIDAALKRLQSVKDGMNRLNREMGRLSSKCPQKGDDQPAPLDLAYLAEIELDYWGSDLFFKHEVTLQLQLDPPPPMALGSMLDTCLALNCLVANAVEAMAGSDQPVITVRPWLEQNQSGLVVSDSGSGIDQAIASDMFDPFTTTKAGGHDGLGLFLARRAIAGQGGDVFWQDGDLEGFVIALPLA